MKARTFTTLLGFLFSLLLCAQTAAAQDENPKKLSVGVVNGKAAKLELPAYPAAAKAARAQGTVNVQVNIDEDGNVTNARAVSGHPLLREAAEEAALASKFKPTVLSGTAVKVFGIVVYNFVADFAQNPKQETEAEFAEKESDGAGKKQKKENVLNGRALKLPPPVYPAAAKAVRAQGAVTVQVTVDEKGDVVSAQAVSGHPLLRQASEKAARKAEFEPTLVNGKATKITGVIVYNFIAPVKMPD